MKPKKLAIIDGKSVFYRGYYAMPNLATKEGTPTGGVFGFAVMALEVLRRLKPDYVCVAWDKPKTNIRKRVTLYPEYKAHRKPAPPDFYEQIPVLHELLEAFGWPLYELDDYEADDIMGTLALQAAEKGIDTMLITSDLDMLQLVDPKIHVYALKKGLSNIELYAPKSFEAKYQIRPDQFLDLKALKGDASDNIPGVPGIGEKGAIELLKEYKTLDGVYEHLPLIKPHVRDKLEKGKELAYLSKKIAAIWTDAPIKLDLQAVDGSRAQPEAIQALLNKLEFRSLVRQLPEVMQITEAHQTTNAFEHGFSGQHHLISSEEQLAKYQTAITTGPVFILSRSAKKQGREPRLISLSSDLKTVLTLNLSSLPAVLLKPLFQKVNGLIGYDLKATLELLQELDLPLPAVKHDVLVGAFLINSLRRVQSLQELAARDVAYGGPSLDELDDEQLQQRAPEILAIIRALYKEQQTELKALPKVAKLATEIEWPLTPVLAKMERAGIELNTDYLKDFAVEINDQISDLEQQIYGYADSQFNIGSPSQLADILFNKLQLPTQGIKKGKTGYSTAASELEKLRSSHPIIDLISQFREVTKLKNTYVDTLPKQVDQQSRIHTTFNLTIAQTGRLSSTDPNLQNIPIRTDLGKRIRRAFVAGKGRVFVSADYSQFELRLAAYLSQDQDLIKQFNQDIDVHRTTAALVYGVKPGDVTKNQRREAKVVNFGVMYGLSTHGLVAATGMSYDQAKDFIEKYFAVRPKLKDYIENIKEQAKTQGFVENMFGRRRPTPDVRSSNFVVREAAFRAAVNMPFQGSAADIMKKAMIAVDARLADDCQLLLQIHDSLIVECPAAKAAEVSKILAETMEHIVDLPIKLTVDTTQGTNWGEL